MQSLNLFDLALIVVVIIAIGFVLFGLWKKRHPDAAARVEAEFTSLSHSAADAGHGILERLLELAHKQQDTLAASQQQNAAAAAVIASPPVQAAINAQPAAPIAAAVAASNGAAELVQVNDDEAKRRQAPGSHGGQHLRQAAMEANSGPASASAAAPATTPSAASTNAPSAAPAGIQPRIDPIVAAGSPGTVLMAITGHVLSAPRPDLGEMFPGYCERVSLQCGGRIAIIGMLFNGGAAALFAALGGYKADGSNWPEAADRFFNGRAYLDDAGKAQYDAAQAAMAAAQVGVH